MKKLLFTCDGDHFPHSLFALAESTKKQEKILLKGFFFPPSIIPDCLSLFA